MVRELPSPYMLDVEGEVPNTYMVSLGAGYIASIAGETLVRDSNAFQAFISQYTTKTGLELSKALFGHDVFRRAFIITLQSLYGAYASARSNYLSDNGISDKDLPNYTAADDNFLFLEFAANSVKDLDKILNRNIDVNNAIRALIEKKPYRYNVVEIIPWEPGEDVNIKGPGGMEIEPGKEFEIKVESESEEEEKGNQ